MSDSCALNADGTLKDTSDITFYNDPDDNVPLPPVPSNDPDNNVPSTEPKKNTFSVLLKTGHTPATVTAGSQHKEVWTRYRTQLSTDMVLPCSAIPRQYALDPPALSDSLLIVIPLIRIQAACASESADDESTRIIGWLRAYFAPLAHRYSDEPHIHPSLFTGV
ncbi:uncharacterized protein EDB91DRAFT_1248446 [Suillus paluster]|uniref:uncharacterized protein n=1 Tax=Suillus paluster TaxID=48578 RepID=UPI001B88638F|nr:uncharacterized protein EDB91DRAFT_1248446 [Suillus paluster]KAG1740116.1 hypothetical protein EDB91DRAFT_1248446 [Suillus paluster]